jgi:Circularly permutated YpsA SLOG family
VASTQKITSGDQIGADLIALDFGLDHGILSGGWCAKGRLVNKPTLDLKTPPS